MICLSLYISILSISIISRTPPKKKKRTKTITISIISKCYLICKLYYHISVLCSSSHASLLMCLNTQILPFITFLILTLTSSGQLRSTYLLFQGRGLSVGHTIIIFFFHFQPPSLPQPCSKTHNPSNHRSILHKTQNSLLAKFLKLTSNWKILELELDSVPPVSKSFYY